MSLSTMSTKAMLKRTTKDNFLLNQKVLLHYHVKSRFTPVTLLSLPIIIFWNCFCHPGLCLILGTLTRPNPNTQLQVDITAYTCPVLIPTELPSVMPTTVSLACHASCLGAAGWALVEVLPYQFLESPHHFWPLGIIYPTQHPDIHHGNGEYVIYGECVI